MKKSIISLLIFTFILLLTSCGGNNESSSYSSSSSIITSSETISSSSSSEEISSPSSSEKTSNSSKEDSSSSSKEKSSSSSKEKSSSSSKDTTGFNVTFNITKDTGLGYSMAMIGEFSSWKVNNNAIKLNWSEGNVWTKTITYTTPSTLKFKFVIYNETDPSILTYDKAGERTVNLSKTETLNFIWEEEPAPSISNYVIYGLFSDETSWKEKKMVQVEGSTTEWMYKSLTLSANDTFKIHMDGNTWYGYSDVKSSVNSKLVKQGDKDDNIVVLGYGVYDIYADYNYTDNGHIYIKKLGEQPIEYQNYSLHGQFNGSSEWTDKPMEKSKYYSDVYAITLKLNKNDRFIIHIIGDYWYGYSNLNNQVDKSLVSPTQDSSNDIIVNKTGEYYIAVNIGHIEEWERITLTYYG